MASNPINVETAILKVLENVTPLPIQTVLLTTKLLGLTLAEDIVSVAPFPSFRASIMDGYAVHGPLVPGIYEMQESIHAGSDSGTPLQVGKITYITTGAMVPEGANAVVKIEDTEKDANGSVVIKVSVESGAHIRQIGSDIENGETILNKGQRLGPAEIGLLATVGWSRVLCYRKPVVGVLSTGNELVECVDTPVGSQIRDSNRLSLLTSFLEDGHDAIDLGIVSDSKEALRLKLLEAAALCDVVVTSGGVSMGAADFVKPLLNEIGVIHFSKLNMKPGKPTTFATFSHVLGDGTSRSVLFFGLPGNPVSCLVTKALFVDPALRRLQGCSAEDCLHAQLRVKLEGCSITLDPERAEYHRAMLRSDSSTGVVYASSTGSQRSSRLLSMRSSNALLFLPQGPGVIAEGAFVTALVLRPLASPSAATSVHPSAAKLDATFSGAEYQSLATLLPAKVVAGSPVAGADSTAWRVIRTGLLTISDRASQGVYADESGPEMARLLGVMSADADWPLTINVVSSAIVPDDAVAIRAIVEQWTDLSNPLRVDLLLTSGGTGFGVRDGTPEAVRPLLHREAPGIAQALLNEGLKFTPLAVMSRPVVGTRNSTFIATLPGSVKAIRENITCLKVLLPRIFELLKCSGDCNVYSTHAPHKK